MFATNSRIAKFGQNKRQVVANECEFNTLKVQTLASGKENAARQGNKSIKNIKFAREKVTFAFFYKLSC